jgi:hypothetical protein
MSSIAQTQPRTGRRSFTLRAYLAGTAATAALLGAVVVVFASLGAYVAFNGLPIGGDDSAAEATSVTVTPATQQAAKRSHRQQAANGSASQPNAGGSASRAANDGSAGRANSGDTASAEATAAPASPATPTGTSTATVTTGGSGSTATSGEAPQAPASGGGGASLPTPQVTTPDSVGSTLGTVEQTLHGAGVDVPISQAGSTVDQVTDGLVGGN